MSKFEFKNIIGKKYMLNIKEEDDEFNVIVGKGNLRKFIAVVDGDVVKVISDTYPNDIWLNCEFNGMYSANIERGFFEFMIDEKIAMEI